MSSPVSELAVSQNNRSRPPVILRAELSIHPKEKPVYLIEVTAPAVLCTPLTGLGQGEERGKTVVIDVQDIIGCDCLKGKAQTDNNGYLAIYSYPSRRKLASKKNVRRREVTTLTFSQHCNYDDNIQEAARWKGVLTAVIQRSTDGIKDTALGLRPPRKLLVLINPFSGPGKALQIFQERVVPMLAEAGLHFNMVVTERAGHAREIAQNMNLDAWYAVVIVSGDGLVYEVINGLMSRPDWDRARLMPIGALPGGSGNALCCTLNHHAGELFRDNQVLHSTYVLVKHVVSPMDLVAVDTCRERVYSFLSVTWGLLADIDIESEKYRSLGNVRFTVGAIARILGLRTYHGRLSFLPIEGEEYHPRLNRLGPVRSQSVSNGFSTEHVQPQLAHSHSMVDVPDNRSVGNNIPNEPSLNRLDQNKLTAEEAEIQSPQDLECAYPWTVGTNNNTLEEQEAQNSEQPMRQSRCDGVQLNVNALNGQANAMGLSTVATQNGSNTNSPMESTRQSIPHRPVSTPLLPPLTDPLPDEWITIEDDFVTVAAVYQSHLSPDFFAAPESKLDDGLICLTFLRAPTSRSRLLQLMFMTEDGSYLSHECQEMVRVKAFRLEPLENKGTLCVDGEVVDYGPIQAQVLPSMARVLAKKPN